jgi:hypothetical protein
MARRLVRLFLRFALVFGLALQIAPPSAVAGIQSATHDANRPSHALDLSQFCNRGNCDAAFARMRAGRAYYLRAGTWTFTRPFRIPSDVTFTGDGSGVAQGTDLVYAGPNTLGAVVTAGAPGQDWISGHVSGFEIETEQLHRWRPGDAAYATVPVAQAAIGLEVINPTASSSVNNVNIWKFGRASVVIDNHARRPQDGYFQFADFFIGTSPQPLVVRGSKAALLFRFGGIDLGPLSELGAVFDGDAVGATSVVESVKIEGDDDVPGYVVNGRPAVVFVGTTRYLNQSLYVDDPMNSAPAFLGGPGSDPTTVQCLACTALGENTALAYPALSIAVPTSKWGIDLHRLTPVGAQAVVAALATPEIQFSRPQDATNLGHLCVHHDCDAALSALRWGGLYYLPRGVWTFSRPFTLPYAATLFGDGSGAASVGGTVLRYVGGSLPNGAAIQFGGDSGDRSGRMFSIRVDTVEHLSSGFGVRARDATNGGTLEDISVEGFPDGQLILDATSNTTSGPNFFRVARFNLSGGVNPLEVVGGRQTLLLEQGTVTLDRSSRDGIFLLGGEQLAATRVVDSVSVAAKSSPAFRVRGPAPTAFIDSTSLARARGGNTGFVYTAAVPRPVVECLTCRVAGGRVALSMPGLVMRTRRGGSLTHLNGNTPLQAATAPFDVRLPTVDGSPQAGSTLTARPGIWTNAPTSFTYAWVRCKRVDVPSNPATRCSIVPGATGPTYLVTDPDAGFYLRVRIAAANALGAGSATSLPLLVGGVGPG